MFRRYFQTILDGPNLILVLKDRGVKTERLIIIFQLCFATVSPYLCMNEADNLWNTEQQIYFKEVTSLIVNVMLKSEEVDNHELKSKLYELVATN